MKILLVEDNAGDARLLKEMLREKQEDWARGLVHVERLSDAVQQLYNENFDLVLLDLNLPDSSGSNTVEKIHEHNSKLPIVVLTGLDDSETGMRAVKSGAQDYLVKGRINAGALVRVIRYAVERKKIENELQKKNDELASLFTISNIINQTIDLQDLLNGVANAIYALNLDGITDDVVFFTCDEEGLHKVFDSRVF